MNSNLTDIAIVGIGCRYPGNINTPSDFWDVITKGKDCIVDVPENRWDVRKYYSPDRTKEGKIYTRQGGYVDNYDMFDHDFFGLSPREAAAMDPQQRLLLEVVYEASEDAGIDPKSLAGTNVGVFVGLFMHDYENILNRSSEQNTIGPYNGTGGSTTLAANRISFLYDFNGPSFVVDTACSSSLIAIHLACQSIVSGESKAAFAGGVNISTIPEIVMSLCRANMLSPDARCKAFDARANGYARSEGVGMLLLKPLEDAVSDGDDIYAVIKGTAINQDGQSDGQTVPSAEAQKRLMVETLQKTGLKPYDVQYVEAHGTGTPVGDPIEANSIGEVFSAERKSEEPLIMGSVKSNIGHTEAAAGVAGVIKLALMLKNKKIVPNLHFENPNPEINFEQLNVRIPVAMEDWEVSKKEKRRCGVNSFGFGGSNAFALLEEYPKEHSIENVETVEDLSQLYIVPLTGYSEESLKSVAVSYVSYLEKDNQLLSPCCKNWLSIVN